MIIQNKRFKFNITLIKINFHWVPIISCLHWNVLLSEYQLRFKERTTTDYAILKNSIAYALQCVSLREAPMFHPLCGIVCTATLLVASTLATTSCFPRLPPWKLDLTIFQGTFTEAMPYISSFVAHSFVTYQVLNKFSCLNTTTAS